MNRYPLWKNLFVFGVIIVAAIVGAIIGAIGGAGAGLALSQKLRGPAPG